MSIEFNKELARKYHMEIIGKWNFDLIDEIIHDNYNLSDTSVTLLKSDNPQGKENFRQRMMDMKKGMPDMKYRIFRIVAEGDAVVTWWTVEGTQADVLFGFPSNGRRMKVFGTIYFKIQDKKIIRADVNFDTYSFLVQLGHIKLSDDTSKDVLDYLRNVEKMTTNAIER